MFQVPEYTRTVSLRLSDVLADIGVDERTILKRRRSWLLMESMDTLSMQLRDINISGYFLGSMSEGSTTPGLHSDTDQLTSLQQVNLIQNWADWEPGVKNYLMIQGESVSPGYCLLQYLRNDVPLPHNHEPYEPFCKNRRGEILLQNTLLTAVAADVTFFCGVRNGPAYTYKGQTGIADYDMVLAFPCKTWPLQARQWLDQQGVGKWPTDHMKRYCSNTGCFVVCVGSKGSENEEVEWRISTSLAERCLMFNLNITQLRCYILMKMILKKIIKPHLENTITSYMCKTVLFHCIANTHSYLWRDINLLFCLSKCLFVLYNCILKENCPHFIIRRNNLMRGHIPREYKPYILEILQYIINSEGRALKGIECDDLGERLQLKLNNYLVSLRTYEIVSGHLLKSTAAYASSTIWSCLTLVRNSSYEEAIQTLLKYIFKLVSISNQCKRLDKKACCLLASHFCTILGSVLASVNIGLYNDISAGALKWTSFGLNTDVSSGKLKLASMLYCIGDTLRAETVLRYIERSYDLNIVESICHCYLLNHQPLRRRFNEICDNHNEEAIQYTSALCVRFLPCEMYCVPHELRYEMFRCTEEDLHNAVVDSLPYLYFLQYKTYSCLGRHEEKERALSNLVKTIDQEPNLRHRETALNLLGQCMEQDDRTGDAFRCYLLSLNQKERNNAAEVHIRRLFSTIINAN